MRALAFVALAALLLVAVPALAEARPPGFGTCYITWDDSAVGEIGGTGTPLDGTTVGTPSLECYY